MTKTRTIALALVGSTIALAQPVLAADEDLELWFGPSIETDLDDNTTAELQTSQRFRDADRGRIDTYFLRGWIHQKVASNITLSAAAEKRVNDGGGDEIRTIQQLGTSHGILRTRLRFEQRFVDGNDGRMGLRLRPRLGLRIPLSATSPVTASVDGELFWTLRSTSDGGDTGVNAAETRVGFTYDVSDNLTLGLKYLRAQSFRDNRPDTVSHAPLIEIGLSF